MNSNSGASVVRKPPLSGYGKSGGVQAVKQLRPHCFVAQADFNFHTSIERHFAPPPFA